MSKASLVLSRIKVPGPKSISDDITRDEIKEPEKDAWVHFSLEGSQAFRAGVSIAPPTDISTSSSESYDKGGLSTALSMPNDGTDDSSSWDAEETSKYMPNAVNKVDIVKRSKETIEHSDGSTESSAARDSLAEELRRIQQQVQRSHSASELRWKREAEKSLLIAEEMRQLIVRKDAEAARAHLESRQALAAKDAELEQALGRLKFAQRDLRKLSRDKTDLQKGLVAAEGRAKKLESGLAELKDAARAALRRNEELTAQAQSAAAVAWHLGQWRLRHEL